MADNSDSLVSDNINIQKQNVTVVQTETLEGNKTEEGTLYINNISLIPIIISYKK